MVKTGWCQSTAQNVLLIVSMDIMTMIFMYYGLNEFQLNINACYYSYDYLPASQRLPMVLSLVYIVGDRNGILGLPRW